MKEYNKKNHKVYLINLHLILVTKYRQKVFINEDIINDIKTKLTEISKEFNVDIIEQECGIDHIHLLISIEPTLDISKYINILKGHSSRYIRKKYKSFLKDKFWGDSFWSGSYFLSSTGNVSIDTLKKYIENQRKRDD